MPRGDEFNEKLYLSEHEDDEEDLGYGGGGGASYDDDDDEEGSRLGDDQDHRRGSVGQHGRRRG